MCILPLAPQFKLTSPSSKENLKTDNQEEEKKSRLEKGQKEAFNFHIFQAANQKTLYWLAHLK